MDLQEFEQAILKLAFETDARINTASVAYYLGITSREAAASLNSLLEEGVLELDSDDVGNLFYRVPNHGGMGAAGELKALRKDREPERKTPSRAAMSATLDDDDEVVAYAPRVVVTEPEDEGYASQPAAIVADNKRDNWGGVTDYFGGKAGSDGSSGSSDALVARRVVSGRMASIATRSAAPDASVNPCGASPLVVSSQVRCDPRPLPASKPVITSCNDGARPQPEFAWFGEPNHSTALVEVGETALVQEYLIGQPEHQPGMALLLSLILPGTGQIYNGELSKGIMMMVLSFLLWFVLLGWVVHIWSIVDAVVVAERLTRK